MNLLGPIVFLILLALGIPWFWPSGNSVLIYGLPAWVVSAIVVSVLCSAFTAYLLRKPWTHEKSKTQDG